MQAPAERYGDEFDRAFLLPWFLKRTGFAVNAGTFAFDKELIGMFPELCSYIGQYKHEAIFDQPLFNQFWIEKGLLSPALSPFVRFESPATYYDEINQIHDQGSFVLHHFLGARAATKCKIEKNS